MNEKQIWKLKKKICPRSKDPPTAMLDDKGNLLTDNKAIERRAVEVYKQRLTGNKIVDNLTELEKDTNKLCSNRLKLCKERKSEPWDMSDLEEVLKKLGREKSRDASGYANEIFMLSVAGEDLQLAVLRLLNMIKDQQCFPEALNRCNITSLHKKKARNNFENYRGVFRVSVLRSILDRLMYNKSYDIIDGSLTDANVGARKHRSCRDNLFVIGAVSNSVINGLSKPIQVQSMDIMKCFDKLWLEASINALYEAGLQHDILNLLYIENEKADIAVKVNNIQSKRFSVRNVVMQGSVWGGIKCTTLMDKLSKIMNSKDTLMYKYRGDPNIGIGVLGMIDDNVGIAECGMNSIEKNAIINSFVEAHRLEMHRDKSMVAHIGSAGKCGHLCPELKVHQNKMPEADHIKYLGNIITSKGGNRATIEDRRQKGWGKVATIMGIIGEVEMGAHRMRIGLLLRKAILTSYLLFSAEAWSAVSESELYRLEQVDSALLKSLAKGHSKTPLIFHHLETGTLKLRHILMKNRLMYHHHIITREDTETIKKIYNKQKEDPIKGDWVELVKKDFLFLGIEMNESDIKSSSKEEYKKKINQLLYKAAFCEYMREKAEKSKLEQLQYKTLQLQPYLIEKSFTYKEIYLLYSLRSRAHPAKNNYRKMYNNQIQCSFGCLRDENQQHVFEECMPLKQNLQLKGGVKVADIFGGLKLQKAAMTDFIQIEEKRVEQKKRLEETNCA